ncbi:MAG: hypothetical protein WCD53_13485, partial [Microcoleus sp.]
TTGGGTGSAMTAGDWTTGDGTGSAMTAGDWTTGGGTGSAMTADAGCGSDRDAADRDAADGDAGDCGLGVLLGAQALEKFPGPHTSI